jgi:hypothetical protein
VFALNSSRETDAPLDAGADDETRLSPGLAALSIFALSLLGWAVVLAPVWAAIG